MCVFFLFLFLFFFFWGGVFIQALTGYTIPICNTNEDIQHPFKSNPSQVPQSPLLMPHFTYCAELLRIVGGRCKNPFSASQKCFQITKVFSNCRPIFVMALYPSMTDEMEKENVSSFVLPIPVYVAYSSGQGWCIQQTSTKTLKHT